MSATSGSPRRKSGLSVLQNRGEEPPPFTPDPVPVAMPAPAPIPVEAAVITLPDAPVVPTRKERRKAATKPKRILIRDLSREQVYEQIAERGKVTPSLQARLAEVEDFSRISPEWCAQVCKAPCTKSPGGVLHGHADVVIITSTKSSGSRYKTGEEEDAKRVEVWKYLAQSALPEMTVKIAYGMICRPQFPEGTLEKDKKVKTTHVKPCFSYLASYLTRFPPKVILATSTTDLNLLGIKASMMKNVSNIREWNGIPVVITLNVDKTMMIRQTHQGGRWGVDMFYLIKKDLEKAGRIARGEFNPLEITPRQAMARMRDSGQLRVLSTLDAVREFCLHVASMPYSSVIAVDIESTGLDPWAEDARIITIQFGLTIDGREDGFVIPLWHRDNHYFDPDDAWVFVRLLLESEVSKVGHDGRFDLRYIRVTTGVIVRNYRLDTLLLLHSRSSGMQKTYGLKKAVWDEIPETGLGGYDDVIVEKTIEEAPDPEEGEEEESIDNAAA